MTHTHDYWEKIRTWLIPKLGVVAQFLEDATGYDYYVMSETHNSQFVGRVPMGEEEFESVLHDMGFVRNPLASLKIHGSGETEEGSWRRVSENEPNFQIHAVLYDGSNVDNAETDVTYVYAHWEYRWDRHPIKHYNEVNYNAAKGRKLLTKMLDENGIPHDPIRP
jgi:hypothetical protein